MAKMLYNLAVRGVDYDLEGNGGPECQGFIPLWQRVFETSIFVPLGIYCISYAWDYLEWPQEVVNNNQRDEIEKVYSNGKEAVCTPMSPSSESIPSTSETVSLLLDENVSKEKNPSETLEDSSPLLPTVTLFTDTTTTPFQQQLEDLRIWILGIYGFIFAIEIVYKAMTKTGIFLANPCHQTTMLQLILLTLGKDNPRVTQIFRFQMYVMPGAFFALAFPILNTRLVSFFLLTWITVRFNLRKF
jgi:hypothetical protein